MGESVEDPNLAKLLDELHQDNLNAVSALKWTLAQAAADGSAHFESAPIGDEIGAVTGAAIGDRFGACLSLVSKLPYAGGDRYGKASEGTRLMESVAVFRKRIVNNVLRGRAIVANASKKEAASIRAQKLAVKAEKIADGIVESYPAEGNRFDTQSPKGGWLSGERGHGCWQPAKSGLDENKVKDIEVVTGGKPIEFNNGYLAHSGYCYQSKRADGEAVDGKVEIGLSRAGDRDADFRQAREAMAAKLGIDSFKEPKGWCWYYKEDGMTLVLVPSALYANIPHSGGVSLTKKPNY